MSRIFQELINDSLNSHVRAQQPGEHIRVITDRQINSHASTGSPSPLLLLLLLHVLLVFLVLPLRVNI